MEFSEFLDKARRSPIVPVIDSMPADLLTPLSVYLKLSAGKANSFLFESVEGGENLGRYSFIGSEPEAVVFGSDTEVLERSNGKEFTLPVPMMEYLAKELSGGVQNEISDLPHFTGGAIGYLGFSCAGWFEPRAKLDSDRRSERYDSGFMFFRSVVAFDHVKQTIKLITLVFHDQAGDEGLLRGIYQRAVDGNGKTRKVLATSNLPLPAFAGTDAGQGVIPGTTQQVFEDSVLRIKSLIDAGECYQVVLSQFFTKATSASPVAIYRAIRSLNPSPYMFLLNFSDRAIIGASPEMLVRCRQGKLEYRPIAGTRRRGDTDEEDQRLADEMRADEKEVAEHVMLVDLGRNDLGRVAQFGSVAIRELMNVEKYSHVQHLVSGITADLREGLSCFDALAACFPAGTVSGAPKVRAMEIIREIEQSDRSVYAGAVGYFDHWGNMDTCIAIRTLILKDGVARIQAGAGIVADSVPHLEFEETLNKARVMIQAIELAEAGM